MTTYIDELHRILFLLYKVGGEIDYESYVRVKHRDTGTWLHLNKGKVRLWM